MLYLIQGKGIKTMKKFEIGKTYEMRSICDHECVWRYEVIDRTKCMVTLKNEDGELQKCRINKKISEYRNTESVYPLGNYSMCPILSA